METLRTGNGYRIADQFRALGHDHLRGDQDQPLRFLADDPADRGMSRYPQVQLGKPETLADGVP